MTADDHAAFVALGKRMAQRNGYTPKQSSDLYITDGDQIDWMYGRYRIFSFTWELYPTEHYTNSRLLPGRREDRRRQVAGTGRPCCTRSTRPTARTRRSTRRRRTVRPAVSTTSRSTAAGSAIPTGPTRRRAVLWQIGNPTTGHQRRPEAARDPDVRAVRPGHRARRPRGLERRTTSTAGTTTIRSAPVDAAGHGRRPDLPLLLRPPVERDARRTGSGSGSRPRTGRGRSSARSSARPSTTTRSWAVGPDLDDAVGRPDDPDRRSGRPTAATRQPDRGRRGRPPDRATLAVLRPRAGSTRGSPSRVRRPTVGDGARPCALMRSTPGRYRPGGAT